MPIARLARVAHLLRKTRALAITGLARLARVAQRKYEIFAMPDFSRIHLNNDQPIHRPGASLTAIERQAITDDRNWFARHPGRTIYLRNPAPGEAKALSAAIGIPLPALAGEFPLKIVVAVIGPGLRERRPIWTTLDTDAPEEVIRAVMTLVDASEEQGFIGVIGKEEIALALGIDHPVVRH